MTDRYTSIPLIPLNLKFRLTCLPFYAISVCERNRNRAHPFPSLPRKTQLPHSQSFAHSLKKWIPRNSFPIKALRTLCKNTRGTGVFGPPNPQLPFVAARLATVVYTQAMPATPTHSGAYDKFTAPAAPLAPGVFGKMCSQRTYGQGSAKDVQTKDLASWTNP